MFVKEITFRNFRNYELLELSFSPNMNIIIGGNAQGKTNILEGICFLSTAKSHRTNIDNELIQNGKDWFYLKGTVSTKDSLTTVEIANSRSEKKKIKIDGKA
ncbi:MAG: AAA family ATPase, partial [Candidatus Poribacteria bacterium]